MSREKGEMTSIPDKKPEAVIEISELSKDYQVGFVRKRTVRALDALTLEVNRGEIFGFLGPNGAGKTTTLKLLMRLIYPTSGTAKVLGHPIEDVAMRSRIGYLPENPYFYDYLSGRELLRYTGALFGLSKRAAQTRADELLALVGLEADRADRQLRKYSKGMLQRIGIAQAIVNDPEVIFFDEPMSGLDPIGRREVRDLILGLRRQGKTIFFSSHILSDVEALCDRAAILNRGRLLRVGTLQEMTSTGDSAMEVVATGITRESVAGLLGAVRSVEASETPGGLNLVVKNEDEIEPTIALIRRAGGRLVSVNPRRASLEDLFAGEQAAPDD
jgi:ABC-2 type transport system ATP-binding protein